MSCRRLPARRLGDCDRDRLPQRRESRLELIEPGRVIEPEQPIDRLALPVEPSHELRAGDAGVFERPIKLEFCR
jgi:hypothetical protein